MCGVVRSRAHEREERRGEERGGEERRGEDMIEGAAERKAQISAGRDPGAEQDCSTLSPPSQPGGCRDNGTHSANLTARLRERGRQFERVWGMGGGGGFGWWHADMMSGQL